MNAEPWNVARFGDTGNLPVDLGRLYQRAPFSRNRGIRVLDLCIRAPGQGWQVPRRTDLDLSQFREAINAAAHYEQRIEPIKYVYITVDQKPVPPHGTQRRPGWHSDAYIADVDGQQIDIVAENAPSIRAATGNIERTYIVYDALPTLFADGPWTLDEPNDCGSVLASFNEQAERKIIRTYPPYTLLALTPYCVHSVQRNHEPEPVSRTFVKIQFSRHRYNREGNTLNPNIDYTGWNWVPRVPEQREHRYA